MCWGLDSLDGEGGVAGCSEQGCGGRWARIRGAGAGSAVAMVQHNDDDENVVKDVLHGGTNADVARVEARVQRNVSEAMWLLWWWWWWWCHRWEQGVKLLLQLK